MIAEGCSVDVGISLGLTIRPDLRHIRDVKCWRQVLVIYHILSVCYAVLSLSVRQVSDWRRVSAEGVRLRGAGGNRLLSVSLKGQTHCEAADTKRPVSEV
jgi:hypothetical protein